MKDTVVVCKHGSHVAQLRQAELQASGGCPQTFGHLCQQKRAKAALAGPRLAMWSTTSLYTCVGLHLGLQRLPEPCSFTALP